MEFDENKAIQFMRRHVGDEISGIYSDDQMLNLIDIIWDFYEENGLLDIDFDEEIDDEEDLLYDLLEYAGRMLRKDRQAGIAPDHVRPLVEAEIAYEQSLEEF